MPQTLPAQLCGAKNRQGEPCHGPAMANGRCRMHGGMTPGGIASPQFKTGRYSKYLPGRLSERYQEATEDADLLAIREDVALLDARLADVLSRVDTGESGEMWKQLRDQVGLYRKAKEGERETVLSELFSLIETGLSEIYAWQEVRQLLQERRKLVESERKRLIDMQQMITTEEALLLMKRLSEIVKTHVTDQRTLSAISADFRQLTCR